MSSGIWRLAALYLGYSKRIVIPAVLVGVVAGTVSASLVALISSKVAAPGGATVAFILAFIGLSLFDMATVYVSGLLSIRLSQATVFEMRMRICRKVLSAPLRLLEEVGQHRVIAVLTQDIPDITAAVLSVPQLCIHVAVLTGCLTYLGWLSPVMLLVLAEFLVAAVLVVNVIERQAKVHLNRAREEMDSLTEHLHALTDGAKELKLHRSRRSAFYEQILRRSADTLRSFNMRGQNWYAMLNGWTQVIYFLIIGTILFALPSLTVGDYKPILTGYALTVLYMRGHIMGVMVIIPSLARANVALQKVDKLGFKLSAVDAPLGEAAEAGDAASWQRLELKGITHTYYREKEDDNFVLGPIDIEFEPGELAFVVGGNGSGKTTLAKMITGLYAPEQGEIVIDGRPVTDENRDDYRQHFAAVFTDFHLFDRLIGIDGDDLDERARLLIDELHLEHKVEVRDGRLSTTKLSHGQRKRLALLTAYLEDRPIYLFDEWASGQDPHFKEVFYLQLLPELKARGKTVIVVSHDDRYFHIADRIIKLEGGKVYYDRQTFPPGEVAEPLPLAEPLGC